MIQNDLGEEPCALLSLVLGLEIRFYAKARVPMDETPCRKAELIGLFIFPDPFDHAYQHPESGWRRAVRQRPASRT